MINKKTLPKISLTILSFLAVISSFIFPWSIGESSTPIAERIMSVAVIAVPSSLILITLIWTGSWADRKLAQIPEKKKRVLASLIVYLFIPLSCAGLLALTNVLFSNEFAGGWSGNAAWGFAFLLTLVMVPAAFGLVFLYFGAGVNALSRWAANLIWREDETG